MSRGRVVVVGKGSRKKREGVGLSRRGNELEEEWRVRGRGRKEEGRRVGGRTSYPCQFMTDCE